MSLSYLSSSLLRKTNKLRKKMAFLVTTVMRFSRGLSFVVPWEVSSGSLGQCCTRAQNPTLCEWMNPISHYRPLSVFFSRNFFPLLKEQPWTWNGRFQQQRNSLPQDLSSWGWPHTEVNLSQHYIFDSWPLTSQSIVMRLQKVAKIL